MSKNSTNAKSLKGYLLSLDNVNVSNLTVDSITAPQIDLGDNIASLSNISIDLCDITSCDIEGSPIGNTLPSTARFTSLNTEDDVIFSSNVPLGFSYRNAEWDYNTGKFTIRGDLNVTENSDFGNLRISANTIRAINTNGDVRLVPNNIGKIYLDGSVNNINNGAGDFYVSLADGSIDMISSNYIRLSSVYQGSTISSFSDQLYSTTNGDINFLSDTGVASISINTIVAINGDIRITSINDTDLKTGDTITITGTNSNPSLNGIYTVKSILNTKAFLVNTTSSSLITNGNTGTFIKSYSNNINFNSNNINLVGRNYVAIPSNTKLTFGITSSSTNLNSVYGNTSGLYINTQGDINLNMSSSNKITVPETTKVQFGTSTNNYINFDGSSLNINSNNNATITGNLLQINSINTKILDKNPTIGDVDVTLGTTDRGIEYRYYSTAGSMKTGWFGFKADSGYFTFIPDATNTNDTITGNIGNINANQIVASVINLSNSGTLNSINISSSNICTANLIVNNNITSASVYAAVSTITNIVGTNISTGTLSAISSTIPNIVSTNLSTGSLYALTQISTGILSALSSTISNVVYTNICSSSINVNGNITSGAVYATLSTIANLVGTNISTGTLSGISSTIPNIVSTNFSTGTLYALTQISTGILSALSSTISNVVYTNICSSSINVNGNITSGGVYATLSTITNMVGTNISTGVLLANSGTISNIVVTNISTSTLSASSSTVQNIVTTNISTSTINSGNITVNSLFVTNQISTGFLSSSSITTGLLYVYSSASLINNSNTIGSIFTTNGNVGIGIVNPSVKLDIDGGIKTNLDIDTRSIYISNMTSTANLSAIYATIPNLLTTSISGGQLNLTGNLYSSFISTSNIHSGNITANNIYSNNISSSNIHSIDISSGSVNSITIGSVYGYIENTEINNLRINTEFYSDGINNMNTLDINNNFNVNGSAIASISNLVTTNITATTLISNGITASNINFTGNLYKNGVLYEGGGGEGGTSVSDYFYGTSYILDNNVSSPKDIPDFTFDATVKSFTSYIYVNNNHDEKCSLYTINGMYDGNEWKINVYFVGDITNINFYLKTNGSDAIVQYTNTNGSGTTVIKYWTPSIMFDTETLSQINVNLSNDINTFTDMPDTEFVLDNNGINAVKVVMYISNENLNEYGIYFLNCILKDNVWDINVSSINKITGIEFQIITESNFGKIQYKNSNSFGTYITRSNKTSLFKTQTEYTLLKNKLVKTSIVNTDESFIFKSTDYSFIMNLYVEIPLDFRYALYEIRGYICNNIWYINYSSIGDNLGIEFFIDTINGQGELKYKNPNNYDATIKYVLNTPLIYEVAKGYTGNTYFSPNAILYGNGTDPVLVSRNLLFENDQLIISNDTSDASLIVNNIDITPSIGDITKEREFNALNDQVTPSNVTDFDFTNINIKSFTGIACVTITTNSTEYDALYELKGINKNNGWNIYSSYVGDNLGVTFSITINGQIQYTSTNFADWISTKIKFRAMTTTN